MIFYSIRLPIFVAELLLIISALELDKESSDMLLDRTAVGFLEEVKPRFGGNIFSSFAAL